MMAQRLDWGYVRAVATAQCPPGRISLPRGRVVTRPDRRYTDPVHAAGGRDTRYGHLRGDGLHPGAGLRRGLRIDARGARPASASRRPAPRRPTPGRQVASTVIAGPKF